MCKQTCPIGTLRRFAIAFIMNRILSVVELWVDRYISLEMVDCLWKFGSCPSAHYCGCAAVEGNSLSLAPAARASSLAREPFSRIAGVARTDYKPVSYTHLAMMLTNDDLPDFTWFAPLGSTEIDEGYVLSFDKYMEEGLMPNLSLIHI